VTGRVLSVNVSQPRIIGQRGGSPVRSGIGKTPVSGTSAIGSEGIEGDGQADRVNHGGPDKAVYAYDRSDAAYWEHASGRSLGPGAFGENLTIEGFASADVHVGDRFRIGTTLLEVTQPRVPCYKLGIHMGDERFPATFANALRVGFYLRVLESGAVTTGNAVMRTHIAETTLTIVDLMALYLAPHDAGRLEQVSRLPGLSVAWQNEFSAKAAKARRNSER
jgi:MOSC domain-containing protein YiiM